MAAREAAIQARGLSKEFGSRWVLRAVHLEVATGQSIALTGANGSGKTTFAKSLFGAVPVVRGRIVYYFSKKDRQNPAALAGAGILFVMTAPAAYVLMLGVLVNFVSHSVIVGFSAGAGILIAIKQLPHLLHGEESEIYGDQAYWKEEDREAFEEAGDPFDAETARRLEQHILSVGGSRDAAEPRVVPAVSAPAPDEEPGPRPDSLRGLHVLLMEPDVRLQLHLGGMLRDWGMALHLADDLEEATETLDELDRLDFLIIDALFFSGRQQN